MLSKPFTWLSFCALLLTRSIYLHWTQSIPFPSSMTAGVCTSCSTWTYFLWVWDRLQTCPASTYLSHWASRRCCLGSHCPSSGTQVAGDRESHQGTKRELGMEDREERDAFVAADRRKSSKQPSDKTAFPNRNPTWSLSVFCCQQRALKATKSHFTPPASSGPWALSC